jgi:hypothetical protein
MIEEVIGHGLMNPPNTCYINAFMQLILHALPLRLFVLAWPNSDPTVAKVRALLTTMSQNQATDIFSRSTIFKPELIDAKDSSELALQSLEALRDSASGPLRSLLEDLVSFQLAPRFHPLLSSRLANNPSSFPLPHPVFGRPTLIQCLDSFFATLALHSQSPQIRQHFIRFFPRFLFIQLGREGRNRDHIEKDRRRIAFPVILDMIQYDFERRVRYQCPLATIISPLGDSDEHMGHCVAILSVFRQWIRFENHDVEPTNESQALEENSLESDDSGQAATILLCV